MASYAERARAYAEAVAGGEIVACRWVRLACERHLRDLARSETDPAWPYRFDAAAGNRVCAFIELLPHVKGQWARAKQRIRLEDWQCFTIAVPFGWVERGSGARRFRHIYIEVPRKNAKTTLSAGVALYMLTADGEQGAEVVAAATKKEQAKILFGIAQAMARRSDALRTEFGVVVRAHSILCLETDATFVPIDSRGQTQDGANLHLSVNDELHAWKGRDLYAVLDTAMGSRAEPMMFDITTAGGDQSGICYEQRGYLIQVLEGALEDDRLYGIIFTIDEGDDIYAEATWRKANPNYDVSVLPGDIMAQAHKARFNPKSRDDFRMKRLNVWVGAASAFFDLDAWDRCADPEACKAEKFIDEPCLAGLDLAAKRDMNAGIRLFERDGAVHLMCDLWLPRAAVESHTNASYRGWEEMGALRVTEGDVVDYEAIKDRVLDDWATQHVIEQLGFDPFQAQHLMRLLKDADLPCVEVRPTVLNFSEPMKHLDALMAEGPAKFKHDGNPVMRWMIGNVVAVRDHKDNVYPRKERPEHKIDGPVAALIAMALHLKRMAPERSVYEDRGVLTVSV